MNLLLKVSLPGFMDKLFPNLSSAVQGMIFVAATLMIIFIAAVVVFVLYRKAVIRRARAPRTMEKAYYRTVEVIVPSSQAALNEQKEELDIITPPLVFESAAVHPGSESASAAEDSQNTAGPVVRLSAALLNLKKLILAAKLIEREVFADDAAIDQCGRMIETQSALEAEARSKLKAERGLEERALLVKQAD
ncbi:MAG: hypothetical protein FWE62_06460, partial [Firmicutes bacterium]|nr:hypothetical protein [Bacillota bacterium]